MKINCQYRQKACVWHRKCHCIYKVGGRGSENMPFCITRLRAGKCPLGRDKIE